MFFFSVCKTQNSSTQENLIGSIESSFSNIKNYDLKGKKTQEITDCIVYMIATDCQPFSIVEDAGFKHLIKKLAPLYKIPCRNTIKNDVLAKYDTLVEKFIFKLATAKYCCITTDIWTETYQVRSFLGITIHFLDNITPFCGTLGVIQLEDRHTSEYIVENLKKILDQFKVDINKISAIITDGAANIAEASEMFLSKTQHIHCFAHVMNLVVQNSVDNSPSVIEIITKVKNIVTWFKQSVIANDELRKITNLKLLQEINTRWNSKYYMIERFLEIRNEINQILNNHISAPQAITALEAEILSEIKFILQPFENATKDLSVIGILILYLLFFLFY